MKHKRLNRDGWGFQYYPYYQMRIDCECFHGLACLIRFTDGEANYWETPKAGSQHLRANRCHYADGSGCKDSYPHHRVRNAET